MIAEGNTRGVVAEAARHVAKVAGAAADDVDRQARFPHESLAALRETRLLSALIPQRLGGMGAGVPEVSDAVCTIAAECASSALMLAMHSIDIANLVKHGSTDTLQGLQREVAARQLLSANANSEVGLGGDVGRSICAVDSSENGLRLVKEALAISFGEQADLIFACARRSPDSEPTDQVMAICRRPTLEPLSNWDTTGLRGTCSHSFRLTAELDPEHIYPVPFADINNAGGVQHTLLLLSATWVGLAEAAAAKAHAFVRAAARRAPGTVPKPALRLAELSVRLDELRALRLSVRSRVETATRTGTLEDPALIAALRNFKVGASEGAAEIVRMALEMCGIAGYRRDTRYSVDRILRDAFGGLVMVGNDRVLHAGAEMLLIRKQL